MAKFNTTNFEKILLGAGLALVILAIVYVYVTNRQADGGMISLVGILVSGLVARKGLSYWKPDRYGSNTTNTNNPIIVNAPSVQDINTTAVDCNTTTTNTTNWTTINANTDENGSV